LVAQQENVVAEVMSMPGDGSEGLGLSCTGLEAVAIEALKELKAESDRLRGDATTRTWRRARRRQPRDVLIAPPPWNAQTCAATCFRRFQREAEIASSLGHENIAEVVDFNVPRPC
jgi:hypothetical protein